MSKVTLTLATIEPHLMLLTPESHGDIDADLGLESEEMDEEPSAMQFSTAVGT